MCHHAQPFFLLYLYSLEIHKVYCDYIHSFSLPNFPHIHLLPPKPIPIFFLFFSFFSVLTHHVQFEQPEYSWMSFTFSFHMALHAFGGQRTASQSLSFGMGSLGYHPGAYSSLAGPLLTADSPASARISLQVFWVVAVHPHLEFLPGFQGPDPSY